MIRIDPSSPRPPYAQLLEQFVARIERGDLPPGTRLPTVRRLAAELELSPGTVARTFRELEAAGLVVTARRAGTIVAQRDTTPEADAAARERTADFVAELRGLGFGPSAIAGLVARALETDAPRASGV